MRSPSRTWALVLAAGEGRRFGGDKLGASFRGEPMILGSLRAVSQAVASGLLAGGVVVHRADDPVTPPLAAELGLHSLGCDAHPPALSASLRCGLGWLSLPSRVPAPEAALIVLADQPLLRVAVLTELEHAGSAGGVDVIRPVYARHPDQPGHPVWLGRAAWSLAERIEGDTGLARLLSDPALRTAQVPVAGANPDVDTPEDLAGLEAPARPRAIG